MKKFLHIFVVLVTMFTFVISASAELQTATLGPAAGYGFLNGPDGTEWAYTTSFTTEGGYYTYMEVKIYNEKNELVSTIADSLKVEGATGVRQAFVQPYLTKKFFNFDNNYEVMIFVYANTADYKGKYLHYIYSLTEGTATKRYEVDGTFHLAENVSMNSYSESYVMIFQREERTDTDLTYYYDVYTKASYASNGKAELKHTFTVDYSYISSSGEEPSPIFMVNNNGKANYVLVQYEKPYFTIPEDLNEDLIVNEGNSLVIKYYNDKFELAHETKIPVQLSLEYLYTFLHLGSLNISNDILLNYEGGTTPAYLITTKNYQTSSDSYISSYALYDVEGNKIKDITDKVIGAKMLSPVAGQPEQWLFSRDVDNGVFTFIDMPSCEVVAELPLITKDEVILSTNIDRYPAGDSYQYVVSLLQGELAEDGSAQHKIAWFNRDGSFDHYDVLKLGEKVETAQFNIDAKALNPWLFDTDDAREYMVLVTRSQEGTTEKETLLRICSTTGDVVAEFAPGADKGGDLGSVCLLNLNSNPVLMCPYSDGNTITLQYTELPLNSAKMEGEGTAENPYLITKAYDFTQIKNDLDAHYKVVNDIDFVNVAFEGVDGEFTGKFDGANFEINNVVLVNGGLFRTVKDSAVVENVVLRNPIMTLSNEAYSAGVLANVMMGGFTDTGNGFGCRISNIRIYDPYIVASEDYNGILGGMLGDVSLFSTIENCWVSEAEIEALGATSVGGVVGKIATTTIMKACAFDGAINAGLEVGGLVSTSSGYDKISDCHAAVDLVGKSVVGGLVGMSDRTSIENCYVEGRLELLEDSVAGKVGGLMGAMGATLSDTVFGLVENNIVAIEEMVLPVDAKELYAHRIVGYSNCDVWEYDFDNVDQSKPKEEWPKIYNEPEHCLKDNYVVSDLAAIDSNIELNDTTTEGATLSRSALTIDWLAEHGFVLGEGLASPWNITNGDLNLWFEAPAVGTGLGDINEDSAVVFIDGNEIVATGEMYLFNVNGQLMASGVDRLNVAGMPAGVYVVKTATATTAKIIVR